VKQPSGKGNYFLGVLPPEPLLSQCRELKQYFQEKYSSKASLNSPPHITLHMPFEWRDDRVDFLGLTLRRFSESEGGFPVVLTNFGCFEPRVIFIDVKHSEGLMGFQKRLSAVCRTGLQLLRPNHDDRPFHPHLTLAFRDLRRVQFKEAWEEFRHRTFDAEFTVNSFSLLKHDGRNWNVAMDFGLNQARP
jgi:2'-5' RNA ligase